MESSPGRMTTRLERFKPLFSTTPAVLHFCKYCPAARAAAISQSSI